VDQLAFRKLKGNSGCRYTFYGLQINRRPHAFANDGMSLKLSLLFRAMKTFQVRA